MSEKRDWSGLGIDFSAFDPITAPVPEPETLKLSEATDVSFSEDEHSPLHTINKNKVEEGQILHQYDSLEQEQLRGRFRDWWWEEFDSGADSAEFNAGSPEATSELLPILRNLVWPDFQVQTEGPILKLRRVCERHYPASDTPDEGA